MDAIDSFIRQLATVKSSNTVYNLYADEQYGVIRQNNLRIYLQSMEAAKVLLVGEAPGYHGCGLTGIPFTSESVMLNRTSNCTVFGREMGYKQASPNQKLEKEQSAAIVWNTLNELSHMPLMWNSYPFHPHDVDDRKSNRTPNTKELDDGRTFIKDILCLMKNIEYVVAVGRKAESSLQSFENELFAKHDGTLGKIEFGYRRHPINGVESKKLNINYVRHPANGGKRDFVDGIHVLYGKFGLNANSKM